MNTARLLEWGQTTVKMGRLRYEGREKGRGKVEGKKVADREQWKIRTIKAVQQYKMSRYFYKGYEEDQRCDME